MRSATSQLFHIEFLVLQLVTSNNRLGREFSLGTAKYRAMMQMQIHGTDNSVQSLSRLAFLLHNL